MEIKKKFKLVDNYQEEAFLNRLNQDGYLLTAYDGEKYVFRKTNKSYFYLVEFFFKELSSEQISEYRKLGYKIATIFKSKVNGYYYFFTNSEQVKDNHRQLKDRYENLLKSKQRVDRFTSVIFVATFGLFSYLYFKTFNTIYIFVLLLTILLGGYFGHIYIETIKRLDQFAEIILKKDGEAIGDDERCS